MLSLCYQHDEAYRKATTIRTGVTLQNGHPEKMVRVQLPLFHPTLKFSKFPIESLATIFPWAYFSVISLCHLKHHPKLSTSRFKQKGGTATVGWSFFLLPLLLVKDAVNALSSICMLTFMFPVKVNCCILSCHHWLRTARIRKATVTGSPRHFINMATYTAIC